MKLNKVLALALSGVMAVSMLAGCKGSSNGEENPGEQPPVTSNAVSVMNEAQDVVKFGENTLLNNALKAVGEELVSNDISSYAKNYNVTPISGNVKIVTEYNKKAPVGYEKVETSAQNALFTSSVNAVGQTTKNVVFVVAAKGIDQKDALYMVANYMNVGNYTKSSQASSKIYNASYTGSVAIETVTKTSEAGDTYSVHVIVASVTQNVVEGNKLT